MYGQLKKPMMKISMTMRRVSPLSPNAASGMTPASAIAKTSKGNARKTSIKREMKASTQPPRKPAMIPIVDPMVTESSVAKKAMSNEIREP